MKLVFVDNLLFTGPPTDPEFDLQPNLGLMSLVAVCRQHGYDAEIYDPKIDLARGRLALDPSLYPRLAARVCERRPSAVGMTTLGVQFPLCGTGGRGHSRFGPRPSDFARRAARHDFAPQNSRAFPRVQRGGSGRAEESLIEILPRLPRSSLAGIAGVSYRSETGAVESGPERAVIADLDTLPVPAYDAYPIEALGLTTIRVEAGRGCPFHCTFCSTASFFGRSYRLKSPARLRDEMRDLNQRYAINDFKLNHDLFTVNRDKVLAFCRTIRARASPGAARSGGLC